jgi:hypothetical protein
MRTRAERNILWIETFCVVPSGFDKGQRVKLTPQQRATIRKLYDDDGDAAPPPISGPLAAYVALLHVCGPEALRKSIRPQASVDIFTLWNATGPDLKSVVKLDGEGVACPELRTRYPVAA